MASAVKTRPNVSLDEYEGTVVFELAEGRDPEALFKQICRQYDNTKIEQDQNLQGTGPVKGFQLDLLPIWKGLRR